MSMRMRVNLLYKDGTRHELRLAIPPEVGKEIAQKGLVATQVFIEDYIVGVVPDNTIFDDFRRGG